MVAKLLASRARDRNSSLSCCCHLPCIVDKYFHSLAEMLSLVVRSVEFDAVLADLNLSTSTFDLIFNTKLFEHYELFAS